MMSFDLFARSSWAGCVCVSCVIVWLVLDSHTRLLCVCVCDERVEAAGPESHSDSLVAA